MRPVSGPMPSLDGRLFEGSHSIPQHSTEGTIGSDLKPPT